MKRRPAAQPSNLNSAMIEDFITRSCRANAYAVKDIFRALDEASTTPQAREPGKAFGGPKHCTVPSAKMRQLDEVCDSTQFRVEGRLEKTYFRQTELDYEIFKAIAQPFIIDFEGWEGLFTYTPDYAVYPRYGRPYLVEIKSAAALRNPSIKRKFDDRHDALLSVGVELKLFSEHELYRQPLRDNIDQLAPCLGRPLKDLIRNSEVVLNALKALGGSAHLYQLADIPALEVKLGVAYGLSKGLFYTDHNYRFGADFYITVDASTVNFMGNPCPYFNTRNEVYV